MFMTMIKGLTSYGKFENKEKFWNWYWYKQIPDSRYKNETLDECWDAFLYTISFGSLRDSIKLWWAVQFGKKEFGYCWTFGKNGYFVKNGKWFVPDDKSFVWGFVNPAEEQRNNNPLFVENKIGA
jgi:hypothetical protein